MHALRPLNHLLIHRIRGMVHQDRALLVIELSIHARVPDKIYNPLLTFILIQAQASREIPSTRLVDDP